MTTGWPPGLLQDDERKLSRWFASRPGARYQLRKNMTTHITKTWFDGEKIVTQEIPEADFYKTQPETPTAQLNWSLYVHCPKCECANDLADPQHDTQHGIAHHIFSNSWDKLHGWEVKCEVCDHEFRIEKVEY